MTEPISRHFTIFLNFQLLAWLSVFLCSLQHAVNCPCFAVKHGTLCIAHMMERNIVIKGQEYLEESCKM
jgi:hypothetical protein